MVAGNYALTVGSEIAIFVIFAASLHFLMSVGGLASFGHAAYFGLGAYGVAFLAKMAGLPMIVCLLLGPLLGCLGAAVFGFFCVQLSGVYFAMLTLAFAQIVWSIAFQWVAVTGGDNGILGVWPDKWAAGPASFYWLSLGDRRARGRCILRIIVFSPFGYALRATRDSLLRSEAIGIDAKRMQWTAFVIAGTVAGVAGALFAYLKGSVFPDSLGISLSVDALVMVLLGGVETVSGAVIGAIVYKALSDLAGQPDRPVKAGAGRLHRPDRGRLPEGHRRHAGTSCIAAAHPRRQSPRCQPPASRAPNEHRANIAVGRRPQQILWRRARRAQRVVRAEGRRDPGADRPERRRQKHLLRHAQRPDHARTPAASICSARIPPARSRARSGGSASAAPSRSPRHSRP